MPRMDRQVAAKIARPDIILDQDRHLALNVRQTHIQAQDQGIVLHARFQATVPMDHHHARVPQATPKSAIQLRRVVHVRRERMLLPDGHIVLLVLLIHIQELLQDHALRVLNLVGVQRDQHHAFARQVMLNLDLQLLHAIPVLRVHMHLLEQLRALLVTQIHFLQRRQCHAPRALLENSLILVGVNAN